MKVTARKKRDAQCERWKWVGEGGREIERNGFLRCDFLRRNE